MDEGNDSQRHQPNEVIPTRLANVKVASLREYEEKSVSLGEDYQLQPQDVICAPRRIGNQQEASKHPGNERLKVLADLRVERYRNAAERQEKTNAVNEIVEAVRESGGNFIRQQDGVWCDVGIAKAREKAGHALRHALSEAERPLAAAKKKKSPISPSERIHRSVSFERPSWPTQWSTSRSNTARVDHQFLRDEDIRPEPIIHGQSRPSEPEGFHEFVRSTFLSDASNSQQESTEPVNTESAAKPAEWPCEESQSQKQQQQQQRRR